MGVKFPLDPPVAGGCKIPLSVQTGFLDKVIGIWRWTSIRNQVKTNRSRKVVLRSPAKRMATVAAVVTGTTIIMATAVITVMGTTGMAMVK